MTHSRNPTVSQILNLLNDWRHLPAYSLETRVAPFFAVFMRDILKTHFGLGFHEILIPEFPLRIGSLYNKEEREQRWPDGGPSEDQSYNVDYVAFQKDELGQEIAYFVELKTDMGSRREAQDQYLSRAREKHLPTFIDGIAQLSRASNKKQKYVHLLHQLSAPGLELVSIHDDTRLYEKTFPRVVAGWTAAMDLLTLDNQRFPEIKIVFVQPTKEGSNKYDFEHIDFDEVAKIVERRGDVGAMFANVLRQWTIPAGSRDPKEIPFPA